MILFIVYVDITHTIKESTASIRTCDKPRHFGTESTASRYSVVSTPSLVSGYGVRMVPGFSVHEPASLFL